MPSSSFFSTHTPHTVFENNDDDEERQLCNLRENDLEVNEQFQNDKLIFNFEI